MPNPVLSVIVPTRERAETLAYTLGTLVDQSSQQFEIVVSDNFSADQTRDVVAAIDDPRVRYFNSGRRLSMCDNYEFAVEQATGDYVLIIGDDDAALPDAVSRLVSMLQAVSEPTIHMWPLHIYDWPANGSGARFAYTAPQRAATVLALKPKAQSVVRLGGWKYYELPSPYHSAVPRKFLLEIKRLTGRIFHSTQPDVFTAMALPALTDTAINIGETITLNGRSPKSNGLGFIEKSASQNIDRFIDEYSDYRFHESLPEWATSKSKMIPDAVLMAKDFFPDLYGDIDFNFSAMWAYIARIGFSSYSGVLKRAPRISRSHKFSSAKFLFYAGLHQSAVVRRTLIDSTRTHGGMSSNIDVPSDIQAFVKAISPRAQESHR